jgi:hypothetical protein
MKTNRDLLKEAIADAKAVKETAIANAKAALEEAFTPHLKELFASKLEEMDNLDEEEVDEMMYKDEKMEEAEKESMDEMDLDELLSELNEAEEEGEAEEVETEETEDEEVEVSEMSEDDLKTFIEDVIKDMVSTGELEAGKEEAETEEETESEETEDEEVNLDELLAEVESMEEETEVNESAEALEIAKIAAELGLSSDQLKAIAAAIPGIAAAAGLGVAAFGDKVKDAAKKGKEAVKALFTKQTSEAELEEANSTIEELKQELQETNLLNAKLLYTNKIFKAKNLTDPQKVKVLESFDKATTVKEVKLVFETLTESLNNNKKNINESKVRGFASKTTAPVTTSKQPIIESNDAFLRMQKLAGLR